MKLRTLLLTAVLTFAISGLCHASIVHDESVDGDLSNDNMSPTALLFNIGQNDIIGSTTNSPLDRDFWTFTIGANEQLDSVTFLQFDTTEDRSFFAVASGGTVPSVASATGLLGSNLIGDPEVGTDVLDNLGAAAFGGTGFSGPLGPGSYTFWFQETAANVDYSFRFNVSSSAVPEPSSMMFLGLGITLMAARRRR